MKKLHEENKLPQKLAENLDNELKHYLAQPFLQEAFKGVRLFDLELIELLRKGWLLYTGGGFGAPRHQLI